MAMTIVKVTRRDRRDSDDDYADGHDGDGGGDNADDGARSRVRSAALQLHNMLRFLMQQYDLVVADIDARLVLSLSSSS